ncbi:MAG: hypothetical protein Q8P18_24760 [Pseudomonadota bacterium]|nr:hypothetical protein [Pseudomonadota bacterium]
MDPTTDVMRMVCYYDVFRHPLTEAELGRLVGFDPGPVVDRLVADGRLERAWGHVCAVGSANQVERRVARTAAAERRWPAARRAGRLLATFPWVRAVLITGGLSKQSADADGDVDFLLLVEPGSVWTAKSALQVFRRSLPEGIRENFCTNYLLATDRLALDERNMFTAMELATAVPVHGAAWCVALLDANRAWAAEHVPGFGWSRERASHAPTHAPMALARLVEGMTRPVAQTLDRASFSVWNGYWNRKYAWLPERTRSQRFKRRPEIATNHLHDFQGYVLAEYARRCVASGVPP